MSWYFVLRNPLSSNAASLVMEWVRADTATGLMGVPFRAVEIENKILEMLG